MTITFLHGYSNEAEHSEVGVGKIIQNNYQRLLTYA